MRSSWYRLLSESERQARSYFSSLLCLRKHKSLKIRFWSLFWCMSWRLFQGRLEEAFLLLLLLHPKSFLYQIENQWEKREQHWKKIVIILQQPFNHCRPMSRIADRNLLKNFNTRKKLSLQLSQHPQVVKDSKDSNLLNGCDIYRTSVLLVIMKKRQGRNNMICRQNLKEFLSKTNKCANVSYHHSKKLLDLSKLFWTRKLCLWPLYDRPILWL